MKQVDEKYKIDPITNCWLWLGYLDKDGYGTVSVGRRTFRAHRYFYEQKYGPIPQGLLACHKCDMPSCVNPDHIFLGSQADNIKDAMLKKRKPIGFRHYKSVIKEEDVPKIIDFWRRGYKASAIGEMVGLTSSGVYTIISGRSRGNLNIRMKNLEPLYPGVLNENERWFWKRSDIGWVAFKRRPYNMNTKVLLTHKTCVICDKIFLSKRQSAKYCSGLCAGRGFREKRRSVAQYIKKTGSSNAGCRP